MSIGITQLIILIIIGILLFGNLPKIIKDLSSGISTLKKEVDTEGDSRKELSAKTSVESKPSTEAQTVKKKNKSEF